MLHLMEHLTETDKATQIIRLQRQIDFLTMQRDEFRAALKLIGNLPYDEKNQDEDGSWRRVPDCDAQDYLHTAVETALDALWRA